MENWGPSVSRALVGGGGQWLGEGVTLGMGDGERMGQELGMADSSEGWNEGEFEGRERRKGNMKS